MTKRLSARTLCRVTALLSVSPSLAAAGPASGGNLLVNPGFESGLTGWTIVSGTPAVAPYGSPGLPTIAVSDHIGGESSMLRDGGGGNGAVRQVVSLGPNPQTSNLRVSGFFGGGPGDGARMTIAFLDTGGAEFGLRQLPYVTPVARNFETVLMIREAVYAIPVGATSLAVRVEFTNDCCTPYSGAADLICAELTNDPVVPPPVAMDTELLRNGGFEEGWTPGSPLTLIDPQGWEGASNAASNVEGYSNGNPNVPSTTVASIIGGQANLLTDQGGGGLMRQRLDLRGNTGQFACGSGPVLRFSGFLGGVEDKSDHARVDLRFLNSSQVLLKQATVLPVTREIRNLETVVLLRVLEECVPSGAAFVDIEVAFTNDCCTPALGMVDNLSAKLVDPTSLAPIPQHVNLVSNGGFEAGSLIGSPLELLNPDGWFGETLTACQVITYGQGPSVPGAGFASMHGLGARLLRDLGGNSRLSQRFDLSADAAEVNMGVFVGQLSGWIGGHATYTDSADLQIQFLGVNDVPVAPSQQTAPVTPTDRGNATTLLYRQLPFFVPPGTLTLKVSVRFSNDCCTPTYGMADRVRLVLRDTTAPQLNYCSGDGSATPCPCSNAGAAGHGCANGTFSDGCRLVASGSSSISADDLVLHASKTTAYQPGLFFQGDNAVNGGQGIVFGDGLRCAGGNVLRLQTRPADPRGEAVTSVSIAQTGHVLPGSTKHYQWWYRDPIGSPCGSGFNLSNGVRIDWIP